MADLRFGVLTCSDTRGEAEDSAGRALAQLIAERGWSVQTYRVCPDECGTIQAAIVAMAEEGADVVLTCGGTGLGPRDVTPEATLEVADRVVPGIAEHIRAESLKVTGRAMLSRATSATRGRTLIVNLPGSEKAARECFGFIADQFEHAVEMMRGGGH
jgi:molybdenum cofactor synthesis domain-containing protein